MIEAIRLYTECHADTALISFIVKDIQIIEHAAGINEVSKSLQQVNVEATHLIGVIDDDKRKPRYISAFRDIVNENKIYLKQNEGRTQYLIVISKAIETFLLWNAQLVDIDITSYGFDTNPKKFGARLKSQNIETDPDYLRLLSDLHARQAPGFVTLERLLHDFLNER